MKKLLWGIMVAIVAMLIWSVPVLAIDEPSGVSLEDIMVVEDVINDGDAVAFVPYTVSFGTEPDENIDLTFIFTMLSPDTTQQLGQVTAFPFQNGGYGSGLVSFYYEDGLVTGTAYTFRVQENPTYYPSPAYWDFNISEANYSTASDTDAAVRSWILSVATALQAEWSIELLTNDDNGQIILSAYGQIYFGTAVPGLPLMASSLYDVQIRNPSYEKRSWDYTIAESMRTKYSGTFIGDFMTGFAGMAGTSDSNAALDVASVIAFVVLTILSIKFGKGNIFSGLMNGYAFLMLLMLVGAFSMILTGAIAFFVGPVAGGTILFLNRG